MKLLHLSDLHLGKRVNGFSMIPDQIHILDQILSIVREHRPDGVLIAGDVYDKSVPSAEAVELLDKFLTELVHIGPDVFLISGNHDSAERLSFGGRLLSASRVWVSPVYSGEVLSVEMEDAFGTVTFHLLPFLKPAHVRPHFPDARIETYSDAMETALSRCDLNSGRHVLLAHQLVTGAERCESEDISIGGSDNVDAAVFAGFDYVALGHLHRPQNVGQNMRYCGTPLKYSFSEANHEKSVTLVTLQEKGSVSIENLRLTPLHDMKHIRGSYSELMNRSYYLNTGLPECYLHITLTDEEDIPDAVGRLRSVYPYIMQLDYDNRRTRLRQNPLEEQVQPESSPLELFNLLYEKQNNTSLSDPEQDYLLAMMERIWEVEK